jgi:hypothetical protein
MRKRPPNPASDSSMAGPLLRPWSLDPAGPKPRRDCFVFVMTVHENVYLGQPAAWRRVQGMGRV